MPDSAAFWPRRRVFVTGCTGFLGAAVAVELLTRGAVVAGLVRDEVPDGDPFDSPLFRKLRVIHGPAADRRRLLQTFAVFEPDTVFHLSAADPASDAAVLAACRSAGRGVRVVVPVRAADAGRGDALLRYAAQTGLPVGVARLPTLFGERDPAGDRLLPRLVRGLTTGERVAPPTAAELVAPYLYVSDAAAGLLALAEAMAAEPTIAASPVGFTPDEPTTGADLVAALPVAGFTAPRLSLAGADSPPSPPTLPGWRPATDAADAVARTLTWFRSRPAYARPAVGPARRAA